MLQELPLYLVHYNKPEWTARSLETIRASVGVHLLITLVDNGGTPPVVPPGVRILRQTRNGGFTGGANAALRDWLASPHEWVVITAHDLLVREDTFSKMLEAASSHPELGIAGPTWEDLPSSARQPDLGEQDGIRKREWIGGACMMIRRGCVESTGLFDEEFGSFWEDIDYGTRARQTGWEAGEVVAASGVSNIGRAGGSRAQILCQANRMLYGAKHGGRRAVRSAAWTLLKQAGWSATHRNLRGAAENLLALPYGFLRALRYEVAAKRQAARG